MVQDMTKPILSDETHADVFVPVKPAPEIALGIVDMNYLEPTDTQGPVQLCKGSLKTFFGAQLVPGGKRMTGIETDADPVGFFDPVDDRTDVLETAAHTVFLPCSVFK